MPSKGGAAGKAGDHYEALWTVDAALRVINGRAEHLTYESLDPEASRGVEFNLRTATSDVEFWSLKRQTTAAAGWTLALLVKIDDMGRSILGDLVAHVERDSRNVAVFASTLGAAKLEEVCSVSSSDDTLKQRLDQAADLKSDYEKYFLPLFGGDKDRAREFLTRLQIRTADEISLRTQIESTIALLFYNETGGSLDLGGVRRLLAEYLLDHMHQQIDRKMLLDHLAAHGIRRKDWKVDTTVREKVASLCEAYTRPLREQLIGGVLQALPGADKLLGKDGLPVARRTLIAAGAGGGKSTESAHAIERLLALNVPTLPIRMDVIDEGVLTPQRLGEALSLPASPVAVLAGLADGGNCVLVIDQLDAVSLASGRRTNVWSLFERILVEANGYPNLNVVVACREFDLEHDPRMRTLKARSSTFEVVTIGSFAPQTVDNILGGRKVHPKLKPLLVIPLHLAMFLSLQVAESEGLETRDQLFAAFWMEKHRKASQRLGRECNYAGVVNWLATWLSDHQELSAPRNMLPDELLADADALTSEHVVVLADGRYRFFHETFFDYAFARRFAKTGGHLLDLLVGNEQQLFRRAQVRQILSFLRLNDPTRYVNELRSVLVDNRVRFHIKRVVFQGLAAATDPMRSEWVVLQELSTAQPEMLAQVNHVIANHVSWFDTVDGAGFLDSGLSSNDTQQEGRIIWLCAMPEIMEKRSARVATLLSKHRRDEEPWKRYLQHICRNGNVFHSRDMFDVFLSLIRDGTLDGTRPVIAVNDNWWSGLYSMSEKSPAMTAEAVAVWLDRKLAIWEESNPKPALDNHPGEPNDTEDEDDDETQIARYLWQHLDSDGSDHGVISKAAGASLAFVEQLLPRVAQVVQKWAKSDGDRLGVDPLWSMRYFGDENHQIHDSIFKGLAHALEHLARSTPVELDRLLDPYVMRPHSAIAYLILRAWAAAPAAYADRLARYLAEDDRRLKIGYSSWSGNRTGAGVATAFRSIEAVRSASASCSSDSFVALETAILNLRDDWESSDPKWRRLLQFQLLAAMDEGRLSVGGRAKLAELRAKFPTVSHEPPEATKFSFVGSPVPEEAQEKMTDDQWLKALAKYAGIDRNRDRDFETSGGEQQLARSLEAKTKADPKRFIALAAMMPATFPPAYFDAILQGVAATALPNESDSTAVSMLDVVALIERLHTLPGHPCGRWIVHLVERWCKADWPQSVVEIVIWYAINDPDPAAELWRERSASGQFYYSGDPEMFGYNSTRGSAAIAIARLLFERREISNVVIGAIDHLAHDRSIAVRSQAVLALLAFFNIQSDLAIEWFVECVGGEPALFKTHHAQEFLQFAGQRNYSAVRPILQQMIASEDKKTADAGARLCCLIALNVDAAEEDAAQVRVGNQIAREAAATIYSTNVVNNEVGAKCRKLLLPFFADSDEGVREKAASAFHHISDLDTQEQSTLLGAFLDAAPGAKALEPVIRALEDSPVRLPDLVCRLIEMGVEAFQKDGGDIRTHGAMAAYDLSKIVIRLYTQSEDEVIKKRCLDAIDTMEQAGFLGLSDELGRIDR